MGRVSRMYSLRNTEDCLKCSSQMIIWIYVALLGDVLKGREWKWRCNMVPWLLGPPKMEMSLKYKKGQTYWRAVEANKQNAVW